MNEDKKLEEQVLVFSSSNTIFVLDNDKSIKEIASRENGINVLCSHNGELYDGGWDNNIRGDEAPGGPHHEHAHHDRNNTCNLRGRYLVRRLQVLFLSW